MWPLIRLTFWRRRGKQQRAVDRLPQTEGGLHISPQIGNDHLLAYSPFSASIGSVGGQGDIHHPIHEPECRSNLVKDERGVRRVVNTESNIFGGGFGFVCHGGTCQFWEWNGAETCLMPFIRSISKMKAARWRDERKKSPDARPGLRRPVGDVL